jgi:hypothetical protein
VFGPPGTGKTTHLVTEEIIPLMEGRQDRRILVLSPTNKAADVLARRILEKTVSGSGQVEWLYRFGSTGDRNLSRYCPSEGWIPGRDAMCRIAVVTTVARFAYDRFPSGSDHETVHLRDFEWDYIVIDEASMIGIASIVHVLYQARDARFVIAGDPFQIPPVSMARLWKDMNIYDMVQLDRFVNPATVPHDYEIISLRTQYRSLPAIGKTFSHYKYEGVLEHARHPESRRIPNFDGIDFRELNVIRFPVRGEKALYKPRLLGKSSYHIHSAILAFELVRYIRKHVEKKENGIFRIGVICPYRAQSDILERLNSLDSDSFRHSMVQTGTVHGFQGDECDMVMVILNPPASGLGPGTHINKPNILNVAMSRARDCLIFMVPDGESDVTEGLGEMKKIEAIMREYSGDSLAEFESRDIEKAVFNKAFHIEENSIFKTHLPVNVYAARKALYEMILEANELDIVLG